MASIICEPCIGVCETACVDVCPVDAINGPLSVEEIQAIKDDGEEEKLAEVQMFIDPDECIDCGACIDECPQEAIFDEDEVPERWENFIDKNAEFYSD